MPQIRDPFVYEVIDRLRAKPSNMLISPKARQPTSRGREAQAIQYVAVISVMNEKSANTICDLGFMLGSHIFWSRTFTMATAGYWYRNHVHYTLTSDYQVVARFRIVDQDGGAAEGDVVHMNVNGYYLEEYTSP